MFVLRRRLRRISTWLCRKSWRQWHKSYSTALGNSRSRWAWTLSLSLWKLHLTRPCFCGQKWHIFDKFLKIKNTVTCFLCQFVSLFDHVKQIPKVFIGRSQALDVVSHSDEEDGTAIDVFAAKSVLSWLMDLVDDGFIGGDLVRSVVFVPLDPLFPHFDGLFSVELAGDWEPGDGVDVGV